MKNSKFILLVGLSFLDAQSCWPKQEQKKLWDPIFVFQVQWILNAGLPDARLSVARPSLKAFYLKDGNVVVGETEVDTDSFYVIKIGQDLADKIPAGENVLLFKRDVRYTK